MGIALSSFTCASRGAPGLPAARHKRRRRAPHEIRFVHREPRRARLQRKRTAPRRECEACRRCRLPAAPCGRRGSRRAGARRRAASDSLWRTDGESGRDARRYRGADPRSFPPEKRSSSSFIGCARAAPAGGVKTMQEWCCWSRLLRLSRPAGSAGLRPVAVRIQIFSGNGELLPPSSTLKPSTSPARARHPTASRSRYTRASGV